MADLITESMRDNWKPVLDDTPEEYGLSRRDIMTIMLENQKKYIKMAGKGERLVETDAVANSTIAQTGSNVDTWSPVLIKMARRLAPNLMATDMFGTQPMNAPDQIVFAIRARYDSPTGAEALFNSINTGHSGDKAADAGDQHGFPNGHVTGADANDVAFGKGMSTENAEKLGAGIAWGKMAFSIEKTSVSAKSRGLYASYSLELAQDLANVHGENVDNILSDILTTEIAVEMNREFVKTMLVSAKLTDRFGANSGVLDVGSELEGRWALERWKLLLMVIELESNAIGYDTRRGKANFIVCSADFASALRMAGMLDYTPALSSQGQMNPDVNGPSYIGNLVTGHRVMVDPYATIPYYALGYKGANQMDAGVFFAPYTPLEMFRGQGSESLTDTRMGFKTRYGLVANPFVSKNADGTEKAGKGLGQGENEYFRKCWIKALM